MKRQAVAYWEIIFANAIFNKRLVSRMYKLSKLNNKKIANYEKIQQNFEKHFTKEDIWVSNT